MKGSFGYSFWCLTKRTHANRFPLVRNSFLQLCLITQPLSDSLCVIPITLKTSHQTASILPCGCRGGGEDSGPEFSSLRKGLLTWGITSIKKFPRENVVLSSDAFAGDECPVPFLRCQFRTRRQRGFYWTASLLGWTLQLHSGLNTPGRLAAKKKKKTFSQRAVSL